MDFGPIRSRAMPRTIGAVEHRARGGDPFPVQYLLRAVGFGVLVTMLVLVSLVVYAVLPGHEPLDAGPYTGVLAAALVAGIVVARLPWRDMFEEGIGQAALYAWSVFDIALITAAVAFTGKGASELWILYSLTSVFFAAAYPRRGQAWLFAATVAVYVVTIGLLGFHVTTAVLFVRMSILALVALLASFLSAELAREAGVAAEARGETEHVAGSIERFLSRLVNTQEEERVRVGRELHDELSQLLTSILHFSRRLEHDLSGEDARRAAQIVRTAERALAGTRSLVRALRPVELDHLGLVSAVRRLVFDIEEGQDVHIAVRAEGMEERLSPELETAAYRVIQEALSNVVRHSRASDVDIELVRRGAVLFVAVQDNGIGFDPVAVSRAGEEGGVGLIGMLERARLVDGEVRIESAPGRGTLVRMLAPVPPAHSNPSSMASGGIA